MEQGRRTSTMNTYIILILSGPDPILGIQFIKEITSKLRLKDN